MELTIAERLVLRGILPREGNVVTHGLCGRLSDILDFTDEELVRFTPLTCVPMRGTCVVCKSKGPFEEVPHLFAMKCENCGFEIGLGEPGAVVWRTRDIEGNELGDDRRDIDLSEAAADLIVRTLRILEVTPVIDKETGTQTADGSLTPETYQLYLKFIPDEATPAPVEAAAD